MIIITNQEWISNFFIVILWRVILYLQYNYNWIIKKKKDDEFDWIHNLCAFHLKFWSKWLGLILCNIITLLLQLYNYLCNMISIVIKATNCDTIIIIASNFENSIRN